MKILERDERSGKMGNGLDRLHALDLPHIFIKDLEDPILSKADIHYLKNVRRLRTGSYLTATDGNGAWRTFELQGSSVLPTDSTEYCESQKSTSELFISVTKPSTKISKSPTVSMRAAFLRLIRPPNSPP